MDRRTDLGKSSPKAAGRTLTNVAQRAFFGPRKRTGPQTPRPALFPGWYHETRIADWRSFSDIKIRYPHADVLPGNRVIFDLKGNTYRLVVRINDQSGCIFVRFVGTHAAYDKIDPITI